MLREKKVYSQSSNFGFKMDLTWVVIFWNMCNSLHLYIYPEGQIEYPLKLVNFLERALLLLFPGVTKKPCGLFFDYTHTHTHTRLYITHTYTRMSHTRYTDTCICHTHKHVTHTHLCHTYTHYVMEIQVNTHTYLSIWARAPWYALPSPAAFLGRLHTLEC